MGETACSLAHVSYTLGGRRPNPSWVAGSGRWIVKTKVPRQPALPSAWNCCAYRMHCNPPHLLKRCPQKDYSLYFFIFTILLQIIVKDVLLCRVRLFSVEAAWAIEGAKFGPFQPLTLKEVGNLVFPPPRESEGFQFLSLHCSHDRVRDTGVPFCTCFARLAFAMTLFSLYGLQV